MSQAMNLSPDAGLLYYAEARRCGIRAVPEGFPAMSAPLLDPAKTHSADGPVLFAVELSGDVARVTGFHRHAPGQI
jgi:hypothetical protein